MLGRKNDRQQEIDTGRATVEADLRAYRCSRRGEGKGFEGTFSIALPGSSKTCWWFGSGLLQARTANR